MSTTVWALAFCSPLMVMISVVQMLNKIMQLSEKPAEIPLKRRFVLMKLHHHFGRCQSCEVTLDKIRTILYNCTAVKRSIFCQLLPTALINLSSL